MDQLHALRLHLRQHFAEYLQCFRVGMADGNGFALFPGAVNGQFQLASNGAGFLHIIEERHVAEGARHAIVFSSVEGDCRRARAAIDEEKVALAKQGHKFGHERRIGSGERALVIVHADGMRNAAEHSTQIVCNLQRAHSHAQLLRLRRVIAHGLHGQVQHDLIAAPVSFFGYGGGVLVEGKHGERQRVVESEQLIDSRGIAAHIIENNRQLC